MKNYFLTPQRILSHLSGKINLKLSLRIMITPGSFPLVAIPSIHELHGVLKYWQKNLLQGILLFKMMQDSMQARRWLLNQMGTKQSSLIVVLSVTRMFYLPIMIKAGSIMRIVISKARPILFSARLPFGLKNAIYTAKRIHMLLPLPHQRKRNLGIFLTIAY